ncbi:COP9 signalosome complex subunit 5 [Terramyces sp. JEL0728]|nr:COP9 signalosome complex subunit 5 [Terramyces sp. JEL0728]
MDFISSLKRFELENKVQEIDATDSFFVHDKEEQREIIRKAPWKEDPHYFKKVHISAIALVKLVMHARSGGSIEVMGSLQGRVRGNEMIIMDSFALPVEGTETRVAAQNEGYEYMVQYITQSEQVGRLENAIGWYHSHPGYGCWLSGIDVSTQTLNQTYSEPFVALVVDPNRTISAGKVELGAFRTYPAGYKPPNEGPSEYQSIPLDKIEDFGVHCKSYYQLEISYFKSSLDNQLLDLLWQKYWVSTLSSSHLVTNWGYTIHQINDLAKKIEQTENKIGPGMFGDRKKKDKESQLGKISGDAVKITSEATHGLLSQVLKDLLFNRQKPL